MALISSLLLLFPSTQGWGGEKMIMPSFARLSSKPAAPVKKLLLEDVGNDLSSKCLLADCVRFIYIWSSFYLLLLVVVVK
ncbi:hypothetical protein PIB30_043907 [Stylosanthes scabra]|uniref:Uncharacterized protein n=1 Tax=Stylosanthes scabra TaxID=79078 RepID=A0ABU6UEY6_9FABA|nr:hypothetical protein [Stylosanthes scabra]